MQEQEIVKRLDALIDEFIIRAKVFVNCSCYLPGLIDLKDNRITVRQVYDHEYLAFTKSAKTLISIQELLKVGNNEDAYVLIRSMFENYLAARYLNENVHDVNDLHKIKQYIQNRIYVALGNYSVSRGKVIDSNRNQIGKAKSIRSQAIGLDNEYYDSLYGFLSRFAHLDFSNLDYYVDEYKSFILKKENDVLLVRLITVFITTKIYEAIVTIDGEEFLDEVEEELCYKVVRESLLYQRWVFDWYIKVLEFEVGDTMLNQHRMIFQKMLKGMNKSLKEEIGDLSKENLF